MQKKTAEKSGTRTATWAVGAAAVVLAVAIGYSATRGDAPPPPAKMAAKSPAANQPVTIEGLQARVRVAPGDADAWGALGAALFAANRFAEAAAAIEKATAIAPSRADFWSALGEAKVMASEQDPMPAAALAAFRKALTIDPKDPRSRYFAAVARDLTGDHTGAVDDWFALLMDTPPGAPWESDLRRTITQVAKINKLDVTTRLAATAPAAAHPAMLGGLSATAAIPGPSPEQMRAASSLPPSQQDAMVQQMVGQLEGKLKANPANIDGWVMLMRSRVTLGERAKAATALRDAIAANPGARARLQSEAASLGVTIN